TGSSSASTSCSRGALRRGPTVHREEQALDLDLADPLVLEDDVVGEQAAARAVARPERPPAEGGEIEAELAEVGGLRDLTRACPVRLTEQVIGDLAAVEVDDDPA